MQFLMQINDAMKNTKSSLFKASLRLSAIGSTYFLVIAAIFVALAFFSYGIFSIAAQLSGTFGILESYKTTILLRALFSSATAFILSFYIATLYRSAEYIKSGKNVHYVESFMNGFSRLVHNKNTTFAVIGFGFIAGIISGMYTIPGGITVNLASGAEAGLFIEGLLFAVISGISLSGYSNTKYCTDFPTLFSYIGKRSGSSNLLLYASALLPVFIPIMPYVVVLQLFLLPISVAIVSLSK